MALGPTLRLPATEIRGLLDRIEELESLLGIHMRFPERLGLTPRESELLGLVMSRQSVTIAQAYIAMHGGRPERDQPTADVIKAHMFKLRRKLSPLGIVITTRDLEHGRAYLMRSEMKQRLNQTIALLR